MPEALIRSVLGDDAADKPIAQATAPELKRLMSQPGYRHLVTTETLVHGSDQGHSTGQVLHEHMRASDPDTDRADAYEGLRALRGAGHLKRATHARVDRYLAQHDARTPAAGGGAGRARKRIDTGSGVLSAKEANLIHTHHEVLHAMAHAAPSARRGLVPHLTRDHVRAIGGAVRLAMHSGVVPERLMVTRARGLTHLANPRAKLDKKTAFVASNPGVVAAALAPVV